MLFLDSVICTSPQVHCSTKSSKKLARYIKVIKKFTNCLPQMAICMAAATSKRIH